MSETKDPGLVRETMGHSDLKTTMVYTHPDVDRIKTIIDQRNESKLTQRDGSLSSTQIESPQFLRPFS
jgi:hypothetical protein